jgi:hypothetical protein
LKKFGLQKNTIFVSMSVKKKGFGRRIVRPLHFLPVLTYAAEQSASWQHGVPTMLLNFAAYQILQREGGGLKELSQNHGE